MMSPSIRGASSPAFLMGLSPGISPRRRYSPELEKKSEDEQLTDSSFDDDPLKGAEYIKYSKDSVKLTSPTGNQVITIKDPHVRLSTSRESLKELVKIEKQIQDMTVLPDFGYQEDNYIINRE